MKKPMPEMTTARRWNLLVGASFRSWLTVCAAAAARRSEAAVLARSSAPELAVQFGHSASPFLALAGQELPNLPALRDGKGKLEVTER